MALASDMRSPTAYCAKGIPDTSTMRRPSWVKTKHRPLMTCVPSGFRASGKRSSLRGLAIPRHPTLTSKKADRFGSPPATAHPSKYARKSRETTGLCQDLWIRLSKGVGVGFVAQKRHTGAPVISMRLKHAIITTTNKDDD